MQTRLSFRTLAALFLGTVVCHAQQAPAPPATPQPAATQPAAAQPAPAQKGEQRRHFGLRSRVDGTFQYEMTEIVRTTPAGQDTIILLTDNGHGPLLLEHRVAAGKTPTFTITEVGREAFVTTWSRPADKTVPAQLSITTRGGESRMAAADVSEWPRMRELRYAVRRELSPFLVEAIERMRGTIFAVAPGSGFHDAVARYVLYQPAAEPLAPELEEAPMSPSCTYDESFGHPCSEEQLARVNAAAEEGRLLPRY